jgi:phosphopantetheinyl transferase (holo-ACP synthase)
MTILGIGVDVLHLPRLTHHLSDNRLARRILSPAELRDYLALPKEDHGKRIHFLGVRCAPLLCRPVSSVPTDP